MDFNGFCAAVAKEFGLTDTPSANRDRFLVDSTRGIKLYLCTSGQRVCIIANSICGPRTKTQYYTRIPLSLMVDLPKNVKAAISRLIQMEILAEKKRLSHNKTMQERNQFIEKRDVILADPSTTMEQMVELMVEESNIRYDNIEINLYLSGFRRLLRDKRKEQEK